ncbi:hypothetical protein PACTADRAFT_86950 [Pachysolen tannophilus NRRL Y-2460]|uniref:Myosin motor domain-containing protein n=1 Tax=Pachysolen tannophilus NRRL Y-2460 TaxID=669874 RepID=A0A1E4TQ79_PACTA|nr:hypothetical protein PACTADRAFT_86950 [Pachysolen tannophilus NRRL Y-2460]
MTSETQDEVNFASQTWVWLPDKEKIFIKGYIVEELKQNQVKVRCEDAAVDKIENKDFLEKVNPPKFDKCDDMASLTYLNEPSVLYNLKLRYMDNLIYTYSGLFLVAINPYQDINIYNRDFVELYNSNSAAGNDDKIQKPHIFGIAEKALQQLIKDKKNQSILVTGESGAGKTENTKKIIQYITTVISSTSSQNSNSKSNTNFNFDEKILEANPILESFGNSQTVKNNNSSRFGKFIKLSINPNTKNLTGANIEWYLLEKSRAVHQNSNERNYHIFYQLLNGLSDGEMAALQLTRSVKHYNYLKNSNSQIPGVDDKKEFKNLVKALKTINFSTIEMANIFKILAIILLLGNIEFKNFNDDKQAILLDSSPIAMNNCLKILF